MIKIYFCYRKRICQIGLYQGLPLVCHLFKHTSVNAHLIIVHLSYGILLYNRFFSQNMNHHIFFGCNRQHLLCQLRCKPFFKNSPVLPPVKHQCTADRIYIRNIDNIKILIQLCHTASGIQHYSKSMIHGSFHCSNSLF